MNVVDVIIIALLILGGVAGFKAGVIKKLTDFIGIMNFFNTTATSVISRKKELALLEVVGMTKKQISKMLVAEGFL